MWAWRQFPNDQLGSVWFGPEPDSGRDQDEGGHDDAGWDGDGGPAGGDDAGEFMDLPFAPAPEFDVQPLYRGEMEESMEEWLEESLQKEEHRPAVRLLGIDSEGMVSIMMPVYTAGTPGAENPEASAPLMGRAAAARALQDKRRQAGDTASVQAARQCPFTFITLRLVHFRDGVALCSSCDNPGCTRSDDVFSMFAREIALPHQDHSSSAVVLGGEDPLCPCARAAIKAVFKFKNVVSLQPRGQYHENDIISWLQENCAQEDAWGAQPQLPCHVWQHTWCSLAICPISESVLMHRVRPGLSASTSTT